MLGLLENVQSVPSYVHDQRAVDTPVRIVPTAQMSSGPATVTLPRAGSPPARMHYPAPTVTTDRFQRVPSQ